MVVVRLEVDGATELVEPVHLVQLVPLQEEMVVLQEEAADLVDVLLDQVLPNLMAFQQQEMVVV